MGMQTGHTACGGLLSVDEVGSSSQRMCPAEGGGWTLLGHVRQADDGWFLSWLLDLVLYPYPSAGHVVHRYSMGQLSCEQSAQH